MRQQTHETNFKLYVIIDLTVGEMIPQLKKYKQKIRKIK